MQVLPPALAAFGAYRQFIFYRLSPDPKRPSKTLKQPVDPRTLRVADAHNPESWISFDEAAALLPALGGNHGIGFVFTSADPHWFLDIDEAYDGTAWSPAALDACTKLAGCAVEVSQSGRGLHIFGTGFVPPHGCDNQTLHMQFFTERRFVALTGTGAVGDAGFASAAIGPYVMQHFPVLVGGPSDVDSGWWSDEPVAQWRGPTDDDVLIQRALKSRPLAAVFGSKKACFPDLWEADADVLGSTWPPDRDGDPYNASQVDAALAQHLCFWTGNNAARIERLMRQSALVRDKWDDRDDYLPRTIRKACSMQTTWLCDAPPSASPFTQEAKLAPIAHAALPVTESTFLAPEEQVEFFKGCVYVLDEDKFMLPTGMRVDSTRFNRVFGGRTFVLDKGNERVTRKASEAFTESQAYRFPRVDTTCFRPLELPGEILMEAGRTMVNTWVPLNVPVADGDVSRFWTHMAKMLPDDEDRKILVYYMAACVQRQGMKFQWAPLIQGTTGNGKSMLSQFVRKAIGKAYCHTARAKNIDNDFNAWMAGKTFYSVDEIYIPDKRLNILETLKEMITSDEQEVTPKGVDAATRDICGNFMFFTNHLDGIRKNRHERRIAPFYTAQQRPEDLARDGMGEDYFRDFVDWLKGQHAYAEDPPGYTVIANLLWTLPIPAEYDPSLSPRAPQTSSTAASIEASRGPVEQEILEAIELGEPGFRGGFVSSVMLKRFIAGGSHRVALSLQGELVEGLGYKLHPALTNGRVNNDVMPDASKPKLYVREDRGDLLALATPAEVARAYSVAQAGH